MSTKTRRSLTDVSYDVYCVINNYLSDFKDIFSLMLTCKDLNKFLLSDLRYKGCENIVLKLKDMESASGNIPRFNQLNLVKELEFENHESATTYHQIKYITEGSGLNFVCMLIESRDSAKLESLKKEKELNYVKKHIQSQFKKKNY